MPPRTIDDVLTELDRIVDRARSEGSPRGYFAVLYRNVTRRVRDGIAADEFDDGARMERLDVVFARRYLDALAAYEGGRDPGAAWRLAFAQSDRWWPVVLQHLLLGINAHINLDLGVAAARVAPGSALPGLKDDFDRINEILASLVERVEDDLAEVWPALRLLDRVGGRTDEALVNFAIQVARKHAWSAAQRLAPLPEADQGAVIAELDHEAACVGERVARPGWLVSGVLKLVRVTEHGSVRDKIGRLA